MGVRPYQNTRPPHILISPLFLFNPFNPESPGPMVKPVVKLSLNRMFKRRAGNDNMIRWSRSLILPGPRNGHGRSHMLPDSWVRSDRCGECWRAF